MADTFASQGDRKKKKITFEKMAEGCYAYTAEGDPNTGVIVGDKSVLVFDAQATPRLAKDVIKKIRTITKLPISYVVLSHYHAVRVLGASEYKAKKIFASSKTLEMIEERGAQDWLSEFQRFPRLFKGHAGIKGLTWPTHIFDKELELDLGNRKVILKHVGEGHTRGDIIAWVPESKVMFAGDLVENGATPYCGDAQLAAWPKTLAKLSKLKPKALLPGRGNALLDKASSINAIESTKGYVEMMFTEAQKSVKKKHSLKQCYDHLMKKMRPKYGDWVIFEHCMCFNVKRAYDEANGIVHPNIWTDKIDLEMWQMLK